MNRKDIYDQAMRYIKCNLPEREKEIITDNSIEVYFCGKPEFIFYLSDCGEFEAGDISRNNASLGYYTNKKNGQFINYDYAAAIKWDLENAGCKLSPSY